MAFPTDIGPMPSKLPLKHFYYKKNARLSREEVHLTTISYV